MESRVKLTQDKDKLTLSVLSTIPAWQRSVLLFWCMSWTFCGLVFIYFLWTSEQKQEQLMLGISLVFWLYFEVKAVKTLLWRYFGKELLRISTQGVTYKRDINGYGKVQGFDLHGDIKVRKLPYNPKSPLQQLDHSFWVIGGPRIQFDEKGLKFGFQLEEQEATQLERKLNAFLIDMKRKKRSQ